MHEMTDGLSLEEQLQDCLSIECPSSFFLHAGAGAGKTRALVSCLDNLPLSTRDYLFLNNKKLAVITYTNAASEEIISRTPNVGNLSQVSTIHSFIWALIRTYQADIKAWLENKLGEQIREAEEKQANPRSRTDRTDEIALYKKRLATLPTIKRFIYNPTGNNLEYNSLQHGDVLKMGAAFLANSPTMQKILIARFPIVLIDECQDTNKAFMEALLLVQEANSSSFCLGLFGDTMQRIYLDGHPELLKQIEQRQWRHLKILDNYRSPRRIIRLNNVIREPVDGLCQTERAEAEEGFLRYFILPTSICDNLDEQLDAERNVANQMAKITGDTKWENSSNIKTLTLEHKMAARRDGFYELACCFDGRKVKRLRNRLYERPSKEQEGPAITEIAFFTKRVFSLIYEDNPYRHAALIKKFSPLLLSDYSGDGARNYGERIHAADAALQSLRKIVIGNSDITVRDILPTLIESSLLFVPDSLRIAMTKNGYSPDAPDEEFISDEDAFVIDEQPDDRDETLQAWVKFLDVKLSQIRKYCDYIARKRPFDTHQGVKGLEFDRVLAVVSDTEAGGFLFSYDKLLGVKPKSDTDRRNEQSGAETAIDRTKRLFYVVCSRTQKALAVICYSDVPDKLAKALVASGWAEESEIILPTS